MLDVTSIRKDFPLLNPESGVPPVYLDNACMSLRPQAVIEAMTGYYTVMSACAGRSNHRLAREVTEAVETAREKVQRFIGAKRKEEIVWVRNTSEGLNLVARSLGLQAGEVVVTTDKEHNSNLVPWLKLRQEMGIKHVVIPSQEDNTFDMDAFSRLLNEQVKLVSIVQTSNLDGVTHPVKEITRLAHEAGALVMVDAAQSAPHQLIEVGDLDVDFLAFSGHKMVGPSGMGVLYGKYELLERLHGFMVGGDTVVETTYEDYTLLPPPEKFEAGLQNYAGIIGMGAAVDYLTATGMKSIKAYEVKLNRIITEGIRKIPGLTIIGPEDPELRGGIVSFYLEGVDAHQVALMLDETAGIMIRSGQHCVHSWFASRGIPGSARASLYFYNTEEEAELLVTNLKQIVSIL